MDRLHNQPLPQPPCRLCYEHVEDHTHLFFRCRYSKEVWSAITCKAQIQWTHLPWGAAWEWALTEYDTGPQARIMGMALAATIYHLWQERNRRIHNQHYGSSWKMTEDIIHLIRDKLANTREEDDLPRLGLLVVRPGLLLASGGLQLERIRELSRLGLRPISEVQEEGRGGDWGFGPSPVFAGDGLAHHCWIFFLFGRKACQILHNLVIEAEHEEFLGKAATSNEAGKMHVRVYTKGYIFHGFSSHWFQENSSLKELSSSSLVVLE
ncbi:hypothetical protein OIU84_011020 [Salix udensis]|uniref:Reverse transcriptase zinc-binding domain-containing protein n=1 Tax=Salix udensis TaxID=889485 RepID=A0AAD6JM15_9ROSI|nr:hypothetical protein OIU84_011020 [Salix udensis]